jgi:pyruvate dehydrogenase E2 component (dihydrolipoamide acetyltransferase)
VATDVTMPRLSDSMEEGTILKWLVEEGGEVKKGEPLVEIETDKANMTYDADTDGTLIDVVAEEGDTLPIGEVIARVGDPDEAGGGEEAPSEEEQEQEEEPADAGDGAGKAAEAKEKAERAKEKAKEAKRAATATADEPSGDGADGDGRIKASPVARRMASDLGVELAELEGSGPGGRIVKADVEAAAEGDGAKAPEKEEEEEEAPAPQRAEAGAKGETEVHELSRLQQTVSRRMAESKATAPDFALSLEVDMRRCLELRERLKEVTDPAPSINDMVVKAAAHALREFPRVNGAYRDGKWEIYSQVNVGVAVAAEDALVVPTVFDAASKSLGEISREVRGLAKKVRDRKITPPEVSGGTFTVSNLGMYGIESFTAIINPPQAALLTVGALMKKPFVDEQGRVSARDSMTLTLVCDHRILYGAEGAEFLARVRELLEQPLSLAL